MAKTNRQKKMERALKDQNSAAVAQQRGVAQGERTEARIRSERFRCESLFERQKGKKTARKVLTESLWKIRIRLLSPLHLGAGGGDVNLDAEVEHDRFGVPIFPAKRLRGLLYESGLEVAEMAECANASFLTRDTLDELFGHKMGSPVCLSLHDLQLSDDEKNAAPVSPVWQALEAEYPSLITPARVLEQYTSMRYQTKIDRKTGVASDTSFHNMRVLNEGLVFFGSLEMEGSEERHRKAMALAIHNLTKVGVKRNRGLGRIWCEIVDTDMAALAREAMEEEAV